MNVGVLFSSGLDSTYLVYKNLKEGNTVQPIYIDLMSRVVTKLEKNRVELLYKEFHKEFKDQIKKVIYPLEIQHIDVHSKNVRHHQQPIWMFILLYLQELDVDEFQLGIVLGDPEREKIIENDLNLYKSYQFFSKKELKPLTFPLRYIPKEEIARRLPDNYLNLVVSCFKPLKITESENEEIVRYEACGICVCCIDTLKTNYYGLNMDKAPKDFYDGFKHLLNNKKII